jgi:uncharacterized membrane protein
VAQDEPAGDASPADPFLRTDPPLYAVTLWPHRSMTRAGFRGFMAALAGGLCIPLVASWGTPVAWFLAPFLLASLALVWAFLRLNDRARRLTEELRLWPDLIAVERREPGGRVLRWRANPFWVRLDVRDTPSVPRYLTLAGGGRTIELGAFLTPDEREALAAALRAALGRAVAARPG